ncbi:MAG: helix-turn-helix domain-containing protein [Hyphomonadaceae bacterium]|nr:helix-turn-helix domain-containing protein [Hyphomonadaceae bacterium]
MAEEPDTLIAAKRGTTWVDQEIGLRIRSRRVELRMSQVALAEAIGVTFQQVQKYEKGQNRISAAMLLRIAQVLQQRPADLMPNVDPPEVAGADQERQLEQIAAFLQQIRDPENRSLLVRIAKMLADR